MRQNIERADDLPLILYWLMQMNVNEIIDDIFMAHANRDGLTYGQLSMLCVTYVLHALKHRLPGMEEWWISHQTVSERVTGWTLKEKDATEDRLGRLTDVLGEDDEKNAEFQGRMGRQVISAYELPADMIRQVSMGLIGLRKKMITRSCRSGTARIADCSRICSSEEKIYRPGTDTPYIALFTCIEPNHLYMWLIFYK